MTNGEFQSALWVLVKTADEMGLNDTKQMLVTTCMAMLYPPAVQKALAKECSDAAAKWAKRLRDALNEQDKRDELEWFRDFEWPDDLE